MDAYPIGQVGQLMLSMWSNKKICKTFLYSSSIQSYAQYNFTTRYIHLADSQHAYVNKKTLYLLKSG